MNITMSARQDVILAALQYIQNKKVKESEYRITLLKHLFFADRFHLRRYGIPLSNDNYFALKNGPVASYTANILEKNGDWVDIASLGALETLDSYRVRLNFNDIIDSKLSASAKECLDLAADNFGDITRFNLCEITHEYPEWKKFEKDFQIVLSQSIPMKYKDFFDNPDFSTSVFLKKFFKKDPYEEDPEVLNDLKAAYITLTTDC